MTMKYVKNDKAYALVIVLLLVVLILGISATFMSSTLSNAKQEKTVDISNQSVAAAEMGILYYSTDFERSLDLIKQQVLNQTRLELDKIVACLYATNKEACDTSAERKAWEQKIDLQMKQLYVNKVLTKVNELIKINGMQTMPFTSTSTNYAPQKWNLLNVTHTASELETISSILVDKIIHNGKLEVKVEVKGTAVSSTKTLNSLFTVNIPASFLNKGEVYNVGQEIIAGKEDAKYVDIFKSVPPTQSCDALLEKVKTNTAIAPFECKMTGDEKLATFIAKVTAAQKNPMDFWVHVDDFQKNVCSSNCNSIDFLGTNVVVKATDTGVSSNMNNLVNGNLIINGTLTTGQNMNNLGKNMSKQTIVLKELYIGGNIKNLYYTNLMVLGNDSGNDARLHVVGQFQIDNYTHLCMDIDKIRQSDLDRLASTIEVTNSGRIIYYSATGKTFELTGVDAANRTALYVKKAANYGEFLNNCGIAIKSTQTVPISSPVVIDTDFDFEVDY